MQNVSSSATLFLKLVLPTIYLAFFGTLVTALFFTREIEFIGPFSIGQFRIAMLLLSLLGVALMYWLFMRLKRVDMDEHFLYVTNYFKTYRYPYHNIERFEVGSALLLPSCKVYLCEPGRFGKKIVFLVHKERFAVFLAQYPEIARQFGFMGEEADI